MFQIINDRIVLICEQKKSIHVWNSRVAFDERCHHSAGGLDAQSERRDVNEKQVAHCVVLNARENGGLNGRAVGHSFVRVDRRVELLAVHEVLH